MSVTKDTKTNKWMAQIRVKDWTGKEIHKKKRGFETKREALQWERDFLSQNEGSLGMTFQDFIELYMKDMSQRLKPSTLDNKRWLIDLKITPVWLDAAIVKTDHMQKPPCCLRKRYTVFARTCGNVEQIILVAALEDRPVELGCLLNSRRRGLAWFFKGRHIRCVLHRDAITAGGYLEEGPLIVKQPEPLAPAFEIRRDGFFGKPDSLPEIEPGINRILRRLKHFLSKESGVQYRQ